MTIGRGRLLFRADSAALGRTVAGLLAPATLLAVLAGCSSTASPAPPTGSGSAPAGQPADAQTTHAITAAYTALFSNLSTQHAAVAALQHGSAFAKTIASESQTSYAQKTSAKVTEVRLLNSNLAAVTFTIMSNGAVALPDVKGNAIRENGTWKVAAETFCGLLKLEGTAPKACDDPKITALPH